ncbi:SWIM zinc finger domain-containing protein [Paenibacillus sp. WQ 127069]|uniref:SWIM zinc finger domain-containing protein n=2 Tax=Paenibacillus baimaensis TaxID=2982185 RepID=A0ABT2UHE0_9BACL|nr:SWIM zinc finger domain-containing protein [Paenibacillus sp. WQ 127069]
MKGNTMISITEAYVDSLAINASAMKNGRDLAKKKSFPMLGKSIDESLIFGECKGSGKEPYRCSVDLVKPDEPVFRCSCPSRQFPCKHILGLMYAYAQGDSFVTADIPADIVEKREKAEKREEKREEKKNEPQGEVSPKKKKTNQAALLKKIAAQLEGISLLEKLIHQLTQAGLGSLDKKTLKTLEDQSKQLGNYYIPGLQIAFRELLLEIGSANDLKDKESMYSAIVEHLGILHTLVKKSRDYLTARLDNPDTPIDIETTLEERIGHAWQLAELREHGRVRSGAELVQLAFLSYTDQARSEFVDEGYWVDLRSGRIDVTRSYRPFRAAKHMREEDSVYQVVMPQELFMYPGEINARVRFEEAALRDVVEGDYVQIATAAHKSFPEAIKLVKNQIKNPLSDKHPALLLSYTEIRRVDDGYVIVDGQGKSIMLADVAFPDRATTPLIPLLNKQVVHNQALLVLFGHDRQTNRLQAQPISIVTPDEIIQLLY